MKIVKFIIIISLSLFFIWAFTLKQLSADEEEDNKPDKFSLQGRIVFSSFTDGNWDFFSINPDGSGLRQVTDSANEEKYPAVLNPTPVTYRI